MRFEDLEVWKRGSRLSAEIYKELGQLVSIRKPRFLSGVATLAARQMPDPQGFEIVESHSTPDLSQKCG
ncbi:MAG: hypothetical protein RBQ98_12640, partial [Syntrophotalea acetylenica]|nr:hypothetical protein [Syntrophotalea acetylenica]